MATGSRAVLMAFLAVTLGLASIPPQAVEYAVPRMSYGVPDLQGVWTNATITTLERPQDIAKLVLTEAEATVIEQNRQAFYDAYDEPTANADGELPVANDPGGYNTFWMDEGTRLARVNGEIRSSFIVEPEDGQIPYRLLARFRMFQHFGRFLSYDGPEIRPLGERCVVGFGSTGGPPMLPVLYNNNYQIVQSPGNVMILVEMNHDARIIRIGGRHPPADVYKWLGDSIGHWEDDTLVVETSNFHPDQSFRAALKHVVMSTPDLVVTERFTRISADEILYDFTMDDPAVYAKSWRGEIPLRATEGPIYEYACHEGNYALPGILAGARAEEKAGKEPPWWQKLLLSLAG